MKSSRESKAIEAEALKVRSDMKDYLKQQSKNSLIKIIFEQIGMYKELQDVCRQLMEENKTLKPDEAAAQQTKE